MNILFYSLFFFWSFLGQMKNVCPTLNRNAQVHGPYDSFEVLFTFGQRRTFYPFFLRVEEKNCFCISLFPSPIKPSGLPFKLPLCPDILKKFDRYGVMCHSCYRHVILSYQLFFIYFMKSARQF